LGCDGGRWRMSKNCCCCASTPPPPQNT
jgi:hypothetical protein